MDALAQDLKYALRTLGKSPGFTLTAIATLALGIGANTAIFSVIQGVLLAPLPYPDAGRLVALEGNLSAPELSDLRAGTRSFAAMGGASPMTFDLTGVGEPLKLEAALVAGEMFEALGARAVLGRPLAKSDDVPGGERLTVLSYGFWQTPVRRRPIHPRAGDHAGRRALDRGRRPRAGVPAPGHPRRRLHADRGRLSDGGAGPRSAHAARRLSPRAGCFPGGGARRSRRRR